MPCCLWPSDQNLPAFVDHALLDEFGKAFIHWPLSVALDRTENRLNDLRLGHVRSLVKGINTY